MSYYLIKFFIVFVNCLPKVLQRLLGRFIGAFTWLLVPKRRKKTAQENICLTLGKTPEEAAAIAKHSWTRFGPMLIEVMRSDYIKEHLDEYIVFEGRAHLDKALAEGHGVVLATAHTGNWELLGGALALSGYPLIAVAQRQANAGMNRLIDEYRTRMGMHVTAKDSVLEMIKFLGKGYVIGLLMDQDARNDGVIMDFLGQKAACFQGPAYMSRLKNAPIVPAFITKLDDTRHKVIFYEPFHAAKTADKAADIYDATRRIVDVVEAHIRAHPEEWFWMHDRWKYCKRPEIKKMLAGDE